MITRDYARTMARYNAWQNRSLYTAAEGIGDAARRAGRGAFFDSIHGTLTHLLWADLMWMHRFTGSPAPERPFAESASFVPDWEVLKQRRRDMDAAIADWAERLDEDWLGGRLEWYSGSTGRQMSQPVAPLVVHLFNHQTHHRGQVHAMLTAAGARPEATDLPFQPDLEAQTQASSEAPGRG